MTTKDKQLHKDLKTMDKELKEISILTNKLLVIHEMTKSIANDELEEWNPVTLVISAVGKSVVEASLIRTAAKLVEELKEKNNRL